jgi:zinc transport system permease protein
MPDLTWLYDAAASVLPFEAMRARFMQQALVELALLAPMCAVMGVHVVNFRMAFFSDAISHSAFTGVALGLLLGADARLTMVGFALAVGLAIMAVSRKSSLSIDTVIGVFFSAVIAFGLAVVSRDRSVARNLQMFLRRHPDDRQRGDRADRRAVRGADGVSDGRLQPPLYVGVNPSLASAHKVPTRAIQHLPRCSRSSSSCRSGRWAYSWSPRCSSYRPPRPATWPGRPPGCSGGRSSLH